MSQFGMSHSQILEEQGDLRCTCRLQSFLTLVMLHKKVYVLYKCEWVHVRILVCICRYRHM